MNTGSYEHLILITDNSNFEINSLAEKINKINWGGNDVKITSEAGSINVNINGWNFEIGLNDSESVLDESEELAGEFAADHELYNKIKSCKKRLELSGDPDLDMDYFNDFCFILEDIESFAEVFTFNTHEGFLNI